MCPVISLLGQYWNSFRPSKLWRVLTTWSYRNTLKKNQKKNQLQQQKTNKQKNNKLVTGKRNYLSSESANERKKTPKNPSEQEVG